MGSRIVNISNHDQSTNETPNPKVRDPRIDLFHKWSMRSARPRQSSTNSMVLTFSSPSSIFSRRGVVFGSPYFLSIFEYFATSSGRIVLDTIEAGGPLP